jgi:hypothetical protein
MTHRLLFPFTFFAALLGNAFQQWTFLFSWAHILPGWWLQTSCWLAVISHQPPTLLAHIQEALLLNDLQQWGLLPLPLHQGWTSHSSLRLRMVCLPTDTLQTRNSFLWLTWLFPDSPDIASAWTQQKTPFYWCGWCDIMCSILAALSTWR